MDNSFVPMKVVAINNKGNVVVDVTFDGNMKGLEKTINNIQFLHDNVVRVVVDIALNPE